LRQRCTERVALLVLGHRRGDQQGHAVSRESLERLDAAAVPASADTGEGDVAADCVA
jgi:hypothetical protein